MATGAYIAEACRLYVVVLFGFAASSKLVALPHFERAISDALRSSTSPARRISLLVITAEAAAAGLTSLSGDARRAGLLFALILALSFTGFIATILFQGRAVRCNCFGPSDELLSHLDLARTAILVTACAIGLCVDEPNSAIPLAGHFFLLAIAIMALLFSLNLRPIQRLLSEE